MSMKDWAEREIELAIEFERKGQEVKEGEFEYGVACYKSAKKAFDSLMEDDHSGFSIGLTIDILNKLIERKPLVPIEDKEDIWGSSYTSEDGSITYQCKRMYSLFKKVDKQGNVSYQDNNSYAILDINKEYEYHSGDVFKKIKYLLPEITMPYIPLPKKHYVYTEDFLYDKKSKGDFDTRAILYIDLADGTRTIVNKFYKEVDNEFVSISKEEYEERKTKKIIK